MVELLHEAARVLRPEQLWVNPDCGLKTRTWDEVDPSLRNMVQAAKQLREELVPLPRPVALIGFVLPSPNPRLGVA